MIRPEHRLGSYNLDETFDLAIIGGGINGAGVAMDAASRGLKVILLEKNDFASGCSAHSTRLIHGGLRYLEYLEFSLVYESLHEREILTQNYPHLVSPIDLMIPCYSFSKNPLWKLNLGMWLYDFLSPQKSFAKYKNLSVDEIQEMNLAINEKALEGAVYYQDGQVTFAERLVLENIITAQEHGAICINHAEVTDIQCTQLHGNYHAQSLRFKDLINGRKPYTIHANNIINMAGPWVDKVNMLFKDNLDGSIQAAGKFNFKKRIGGTKGSHILVKRFTGAPSDFGIYNEARQDGRPFFITPFQIAGNEELFLIGTTDIFLDKNDDLDNLKVSDQEINYLISETNTLFPMANLSQKDVINTFIGVRPLPKAREGKNAGKVTRKHFIVDHKQEKVENYYSVVGGKLTTFRSLAKDVVDLFSSSPCQTETLRSQYAQFPINQSFYDYVAQKTKEYSSEYDIEPSTVIHLLMLYGTKTHEVLDLCKDNPLLKTKIDTRFPDIEAQIVYAIRNEAAYSVEDVLMRRLSIGLCTNKDLDEVFKTIQYHLSEEFGLQGRQRDKIIEDYIYS